MKSCRQRATPFQILTAAEMCRRRLWGVESSQVSLQFKAVAAVRRRVFSSSRLDASKFAVVTVPIRAEKRKNGRKFVRVRRAVRTVSV